MAVRLLLLLVLVATACTPPLTAPPRIALLAPFEGRYREIGYQALYAVRLAIHEQARQPIDLLVVDDGGSTNTAVQRAAALTHDPRVISVVVLGHAATADAPLAAFAPLPVIIAGEWGAETPTHVYVLSHPTIAAEQTLPPRTGVIAAAAAQVPFTGGLVLTLEQFPLLRDSLAGINIVTSVPLPDSAFRERYLASDRFVPEPGPIAVLAYDAGQIAVAAVESDNPGSTIAEQVSAYRNTATIHNLQFDSSGQLIPAQ